MCSATLTEKRMRTLRPGSKWMTCSELVQFLFKSLGIVFHLLVDSDDLCLLVDGERFLGINLMLQHV